MAKKKIMYLSDGSARNIAVNCLTAFTRENKLIQETLEAALGRAGLDSRDRSLAGELALGTCRMTITLDHIVEKHTNRSLRQIDPVILQILRVALYQMLYLSRTPDFAAVHQAVEQARLTGITGSDNFVNALLRAVQRMIVSAPKQRPEKTVLPRPDGSELVFKKDLLPERKRTPDKYLSLAWSHPRWLTDRWIKKMGLETAEAVCRADNLRPALWLRPNVLRIDAAGLLARLTAAGFPAVVEGPGIQLLVRTDPRALPGFDEGLFYVQDWTAMQAAPLLKPQPGQAILDLCAAPGGKATHLAELMGNRGRIVACDIARKKLDTIRQNADRLGITIIEPVHADELDALLAGSPPFDAALVDAPCSNTGVLARRTEARHLVKPAHLTRNAVTQTQLLNKALDAVRPGGLVLYSTCSIDTRENEQTIEELCQGRPGIELLESRLTLPQSRCLAPESRPASLPENSLNYLWNDGGYVALLRKG